MFALTTRGGMFLPGPIVNLLSGCNYELATTMVNVF
jgi:hypothetical protein